MYLGCVNMCALYVSVCVVCVFIVCEYCCPVCERVCCMCCVWYVCVTVCIVCELYVSVYACEMVVYQIT